MTSRVDMRYALAILILIFGSPIAGQVRPCDHTSDSFRRFDGEMRITLPVTVTFFDGRNIDGVATSMKDKTDKKVEFYVDDGSVLTDGFKTNYKNGKWWFVFSVCDQYAYVITPVLKRQFIK